MACQLRANFAPSLTCKAEPQRVKTAARCPVTKVVKCQGSQHQVPNVSTRRQVLSIASLAPAFLALRANALIDFEEDDELLAKVRADRAKRAQAERISEEIYVKEAGFSNKKFDKALVPVQKTVKRLSKSGALIEAGDAEGLKSFIGSQGDFVSEIQTVSATLSVTEAARTEAGVLVSSLNTFVSDVNSSSMDTTKASYLKAVVALEAWAKTAAVAPALTGL